MAPYSHSKTNEIKKTITKKNKLKGNLKSMFDATQILELSKQNQRTVYTAIRIAAYIAQNGKSVREIEVKKALKVTDLAWAAIRTDLHGSIFVYKGGRIDILDEKNRPDPWELADFMSEKEKKIVNKNANREAARPLGPTHQRMVDILNVEKAKVFGFYNRFKTHSNEAINAALDIVEKKISENGPLDEPVGYFSACLRRISTAAATGNAKPSTRYPLIIKAVERGSSLQTEFVGWEHTTQRNPNGEPIWPAGERRMIYRLRSGELTFEKPKATDIIPSLNEDPGCIVKK